MMYKANAHVHLIRPDENILKNPTKESDEFDVISMILYDLFRKNKLPGFKKANLFEFML